MFSDSSAEISLNVPARCISSVRNDTRNHRFLVGSCSLPVTPFRYDNTDRHGMEGSAAANPIYLLRYHEDMNELSIDAQLGFEQGDSSTVTSQGEIWSCSSCPLDATLLLACRSAPDDVNGTRVSTTCAPTETALWRIPHEALRQDELDFYPDADVGDFDRDRGHLEELNETMSKVCSLDLGPGRVADMQWNPGCIPSCGDMEESVPALGQITRSNLLTVQSCKESKVAVTVWDIDTCNAVKLDQTELAIPKDRGYMPSPPKASWDPHNQNLCAVTLGTNIALLDMRTRVKVTHGIRGCHRYGVTDVDYNSQKPHILASAGQDALVKFWDLRFASSTVAEDTSAACEWSRHSPLKILKGGHTHWTTCVKYNSFHDQLILSAGTDSVVNLWRISSISSAPLIDLGDDDHDFETMDKNNSPQHASTTPAGVDTDDSFDAAMEENNLTGFDDSSSEDSVTYHGPDVRVTTMEMREAVYDVCWSAADPWLYATLGYDGNVVLNRVPSKEKYKILL